MFLGVGLRRLVSAKLNDEVLADKDEIDKKEAESHMIAGFVTLELHLFFLLM